MEEKTLNGFSQAIEKEYQITMECFLDLCEEKLTNKDTTTEEKEKLILSYSKQLQVYRDIQKYIKQYKRSLI